MVRGLQVLVSAALLILVFRRIEADRIGEVVARIDWTLWSLGLALALLAPLAAARRLVVMLAADGRHVSTRSALAINLEATFFSLVLPGDLVGGVLRWVRLGQHTGRRGAAVGLVLGERLLDWAVLGIGAAVGASLLFAGEEAERSRLVVRFGGVGLAALALVTVAVSDTGLALRVAARAAARARGPIASGLARTVRSVLEGLHAVTAARAIVVRAVGWTALYWLVALSAGVAMARAVHPSLASLPYVAAVCAVAVVAQLPLTIGGLGLREASLPILLAAYGVTREIGLVIGLSAFVPGLVLGLAGAVVHLTGRSRPVAARGG